jgi:uncharacterized protein involved in outer membrane biogenesis
MAARIWSRHPWLTGLGVFVVFILVLALVWDWNWFRPLVEHQASNALGRPVTIGHFDLRLARYPLIEADHIAIANPPDFPQGSRTGTVDRLALRIDPLSLVRGPVHIVDIDIERPLGDLGPGPSGNVNYQFGAGAGGGALPRIDAVTISDGDVHFLDPKHKIDVDLTIRTQAAAAPQSGRQNRNANAPPQAAPPPRAGAVQQAPPAAQADANETAVPRAGVPAPAAAAAAGETAPRIFVGIKGSYVGQAIDGRFIGGSLLALRDRSQPYPVDLDLKHGATEIVLKGTVDDPLHFAGTDLLLDLRGADMAELFPLTNIPFQETPAYRLRGKLDYAQGRFKFTNFAGTVGNSDLAGNLAVDPGKERPLVTAEFRSKRVVLADLAGFIGKAPGKPDSSADTHKEERAQQEASPRLLPNTPINLPKLRSADMKVSYKAGRIESQATPLDNIDANLTVDNGKLTLHPLKFGVGRGEISGNIALDGQQDMVHAVGDIDFRQVDLQRIMQSTKTFEGFGLIGGKMQIDSTGNSLAQLLARGNGALELFMTGGDISAMLVDLAGLDLGQSVLSAMGMPKQAAIRCMITDFALQQGVLETKIMLFDTTEANVIGKGSVDLRTEQADLRIETEPKHFSVGSLKAPILIKGPLKSPSIMPEPAEFGTKAGLAAALGALATPLGALIPTIQLGLGKDTDCNGVLQTAVGASGGQGNASIGAGAPPPQAAPPPNRPAARPQR